MHKFLINTSPLRVRSWQWVMYSTRLASNSLLTNRCCTRSSTPGWWEAGSVGGSKHHADPQTPS